MPKIDQSGLADGHTVMTKAGDPGLRQALYLAADQARNIDPTLAQRYYRLVITQGKHHVSALCSVSPVLMTRIAACWRNGEFYICDIKTAPPSPRPRAAPAPSATGSTPLSGPPVATPHQPKLKHGRRVEAKRSRPEGRSGHRPAGGRS